MVDEYTDILENIEFLKSEVQKARESGVFGETGPDIPEQLRDDQAELIESDILQATRMLHQLKAEGTTSTSWYSIREMFAALLAPARDDLKDRLDIVISRTINLSVTTSRFRARFKSIYKAAFYAVLPESALVGDPRAYLRTCSVSDAAHLRRPYYSSLHFSSELEDAHLLDLSLVSLSARMAKVLDAMWEQRESINSFKKCQVEHAADLFENILEASQKDNPEREAVTFFLKDVSRMVEDLESHISKNDDREVPSIGSLDHQWHGWVARKWRPDFPRPQGRGSVLHMLAGMSYWKTAVVQISANRAEGNRLPVQDISQDELNFAAVSKKMTENCTVEIFRGSIGKQTFGSGATRHEGSYAHVWRVRLNEPRYFGDKWKFSEVAVKVLRRTMDPEQAISLRAFREFIIWSQMKHANIVPLVGLWFDYGPETALPAFVSPWLEYGSLSSYLREKPNLDRAQRLHLLANIAGALAYMHNHRPRVCHGDINPGNILVSNGDAFVCDFGISHISASSRGYTTDPHGSWKYRAPEQLTRPNSKPTPQSDMYSFGLLFYKVLTGIEPWEGMVERDRCRTPSPKLRRPDLILADDFELLEYCCMNDPRLRATARIVVGRLNELIVE